jgi:hypothetical protein
MGADSKHDSLYVSKAYEGASRTICDVSAEQWVQFSCRNSGSLSGTCRPSGVCHCLATMSSEAQLRMYQFGHSASCSLSICVVSVTSGNTVSAT